MGSIARTLSNQIGSDGKLNAAGLDLADTFAFTGTVSGAGGITMADTWRLSSGFTATTGSIQDITSNWERDDTYSFGQLGTGMTESSGIFTFPSTGIYLIQYFVTIGHNANTAYFTGMIRSTANNSSYNTAGEANASVSEIGATQYQMASMQKIIDCSNTTNVKVKFSYDTSVQVSVQGSSAGNKTYMRFPRLGET